MKKLFVNLLTLGILMILPLTVSSAYYYSCETYDDLIQQINEGTSSIYLAPAADFGWPSQETSIHINGTLNIRENFTIPENVTITANEVTCSNYHIYDLTLTINGNLTANSLNADTVRINGYLTINGNDHSLLVNKEIVIASGGTLKHTHQNQDQMLYIGKDQKITIEENATLLLREIRLDGTLHGNNASIDVPIEIMTGYMHIDGEEAAIHPVMTGTVYAKRINLYNVGNTGDLTIAENAEIYSNYLDISPSSSMEFGCMVKLKILGKYINTNQGSFYNNQTIVENPLNIEILKNGELHLWPATSFYSAGNPMTTAIVTGNGTIKAYAWSTENGGYTNYPRLFDLRSSPQSWQNVSNSDYVSSDLTIWTNWASPNSCEHSYRATPYTTDPTCDIGYTIHTCSNCWNVIKGDILPAISEHIMKYTAYVDLIEHSCSQCSYRETARLVTTISPYTGKPVETGRIEYSGNTWTGPELNIKYSNNIEPGTAYASITITNEKGEEITITRAFPIIAEYFTLSETSPFQIVKNTANSTAILKNVSPGITLQSLSENFINQKTISLCNPDGTEIDPSSNYKIRTGSRLKLISSSGIILDEIIIVVNGDLDGDGVISSNDSKILSEYFAGWPTYSSDCLELVAADLDLDNIVSRRECMILSRCAKNWDGYENYLN